MSLNKVILIGRLGRDPETRYMPNGDAVCNFSLATTESWKDQSGQKKERTEWHAITLYRKLAEIAAKYLQKGSLVYIERTAYEIVCSEMKMLGGKADGVEGQHNPPPPPQARQQSDAPVPQDEIDDSIPF